MARLVVLTGWPASGKSAASRFLEQSLGYSRLGGDGISMELSHMAAGESQRNERFGAYQRRFEVNS